MPKYWEFVKKFYERLLVSFKTFSDQVPVLECIHSAAVVLEELFEVVMLLE